MKNNKLFILLLVALASVAIYFFTTQTSGTLGITKNEKSDFAIKDTSSIDKIFIADANGQKVTLTRSEKAWMVDGKYVARPDNIRLLMKTFSRIAVRSPVPKAAFNNTVKMIATSGIKVEIYQGGEKPSKTYYVGGSTLDHQGTYMILESEGIKSSVPYIMYIPGNYGYLTTRFFTEPEQWRDAVVFRYLPEEIKSVEIDYYETPEESFIISNDNNNYTISETGASEIMPNIESDLLKEYLKKYQKIYYEMIDVESSKEKKDSIINSSPYISVEVKDFIGGSNKIILYHMPNFRKTLNPETNEEYPYDVDRMYAYLNDELFIYVQFATFDNITYPRRYFLTKKK